MKKPNRGCEICGAHPDECWYDDYVRMWVCDRPECEREIRDGIEEERQRAHDEVDEYYGYL